MDLSLMDLLEITIVYTSEIMPLFPQDISLENIWFFKRNM